MAAVKIQSTRNYRLFERVGGKENRPLEPKRHRALLVSMKRFGFLDVFPIVCTRDADGRLIVKDGQHRLSFAETLGLPVHYVVAETEFDVAVVNSSAKPWTVLDYARKYAAQGLAPYAELLEFQERHAIPIGLATSLLSGTTSWGNVREAFYTGVWKIKDRDWADAVAGLYCGMCRMSPELKNARFVEACMSVCRVPEFSAERLLTNAARCREKLVPYSTRDAFLEMLENVYNFGRSKMVGLKAAAIMAMRERSPYGEKTYGRGKGAANGKHRKAAVAESA